MPPGRGPEWDYVEEVTPKANCGKVKCKLWLCEFSGGASRIRGHILNICGRGVQPCTVEESKLKPAVEVLKRAERLSAATQKHRAQKRQLDTEIASGSSAAEQQGTKKLETLAECTRGATMANREGWSAMR